VKKGGYGAQANAAQEYGLEYDLEYALEHRLANETATMPTYFFSYKFPALAPPEPLSVHESGFPGAFLSLDFEQRLPEQRASLRMGQLTSAHALHEGEDPGVLRVG